MSYCKYIQANKSVQSEAIELHTEYHNFYYGFPIEDDNELFGRLILEINQAGLNWGIILKKQNNFRAAFNNFCIEEIAGFKDDDFMRLVSDKSIIRNKRKIEAVIHNAQVIMQLKKEFGSFKNWLDKNSMLEGEKRTHEEWTKLFKKTFKFTGGEIVFEFLTSTGYLENPHDPDCPVYAVLQEIRS